MLAIDVKWERELLFLMLAEAKAQAKADGSDVPVDLCVRAGDFSSFAVRPHGTAGYEWLLAGREATLRVGEWPEPTTRPSVMAEIRSEALWHQGPAVVVQRLCAMIEGCGGRVERVKVSRVDLCADLLMPASLWDSSLVNHAVTRATGTARYEQHRELTGIGVGSGAVSARLYDKPLEIATKSQKVWMYDVWKLPAVPDGCRVIRVEYQLRREALKDLSIDTYADLTRKARGLWAYCTRRWLKFMDDPTVHHTMQRTLPWWRVVQAGFAGAQDAEPLVREKAIRADEDQLLAQTVGLVSSWSALRQQGYELNESTVKQLERELPRLVRPVMSRGHRKAFAEKVREKIPKYRRIMNAAFRRRDGVGGDGSSAPPGPVVSSGDATNGEKS